MKKTIRKGKATVNSVLRTITGADRKKRPDYPNRKTATVFVTGDLGKLGTLVCEKLSPEYTIIGYDKDAGYRENLDNTEYLTKKMAGSDYVVHLAAIPHPGKGTMDDYFQVNVQGTFNVLKAAERNEIRRFIFISSTAFYGCDIKGRLLPSYFPIDEKHPVASVPGSSQGSLDAYNQSKVMAEQLCAYYGTNGDFEVITLRSAPANDNGIQYRENFNWKQCNDWRRGAFWANNSPVNMPNAVYLALQSDKSFFYEPFNVANKYTDKRIDVAEFLKTDYPDVEVRIDLADNPCLIDTRKIQKQLGFRSVDCR